MKFYHGTTLENWNKIKQEGILWGKRNIPGYPNISRCTYLAASLEEASYYGSIVLEVNYDPTLNSTYNNYIEGSWQCRVYEPIPISDINVIEYNTSKSVRHPNAEK